MVQSECMDVIQERSVSVSFGSSPSPSHPLLSSNTAIQVYTLLFCAMCAPWAVRLLCCSLICCAVCSTRCEVNTMYKLPCSLHSVQCSLLCCAVCSPWSGLVGSDAPLPHLPSLDTKESVAKMGVILTIAIIPTHNHCHSFRDLIQSKFGWEAGCISTWCKWCHIILSTVWISSWYKLTFIWSLIRKFHSCYVKLAW